MVPEWFKWQRYARCSLIIKRNLAIIPITKWQISLKQNYSILMNGQKFLNNQVQNILCLLPSTMMGLLYGPAKKRTATGAFPWNAAEVGPKRDLIGDLFTAVRKTSVHAGMYYSLYEWYNPLWKSDRNKFVTEHTWPQMKELINTYQPDVFWTDGEWDAPAETWKSQEFLDMVVQ